MTAPDPANGSETGTKASAGNDPKDTGRSGEELSPEAMRAELDRARREAAKYRERAREFADDETYKRAKDAVAALEKVENDKKSEVEKLTERSEQLLHRSASAEGELAKLRVALSAGVDASQVDEFASRLRGDSEEELKADAVQLAKFFSPATTPRRGDPSQGAGSDRTAPVDPIQAALEDKLGIAH